MQSQKLTHADEASTTGWLGAASLQASVIGAEASVASLEASSAGRGAGVTSSLGLALASGLVVELASPPGPLAAGAEGEEAEHAAEPVSSIIAKASRRRMGSTLP
jgi:hypothetical protein